MSHSLETGGLFGQWKTFYVHHWQDWYWSWSCNTLPTWCKELTHWKRLWGWEEWRQEEKGVTEDDMVGWQHRLNGHELEQTPGDSEGQGSLVCCSPWGCRVGYHLVTKQHRTNSGVKKKKDVLQKKWKFFLFSDLSHILKRMKEERQRVSPKENSLCGVLLGNI